MLSVQRVTATPSSVKHMQYAYLEHLQLYPTAAESAKHKRSEQQAAAKNEPSFLDRLEHAHLQTPSMKERGFMKKRTQFHEQEELLQQMNYTNGLHYSQLHTIEELHKS